MTIQQTEIIANATIAEGENVPDIQSLAQRAQDFSDKVDWWNTAIVWVLVFAALVAVGTVLSTYMAFRRAKQFADSEGALNAAKEKILDNALRDKTLEIEALKRDGADAKTAQQKVEIDLSKQKELTARAQKDLLELQERVKPRHLTAEQAKELIQSLKGQPKGQLEIRTLVGNPESHNFGLELKEVFKASGWTVTLSDEYFLKF